MVRISLLAALLATGPVAFAQEGHGGEPSAAAGEPHVTPGGTITPDHDPAAGHGEAAAHGEAAHDLAYTGDADHDGTPNWRDADAGEHYVVGPVLWHCFNLGLLLALFWWAGRAGVKDALHKRAVGIKADLVEAADAKAAAERRHGEVADRLAKLEGEIAAMKDRARAEALAEEERIRARAEETARRIAETAQRQIADEAARARTALRTEAVEIAVQLASGILEKNVAAGDQRRLAEQFLASLDQEH